MGKKQYVVLAHELDYNDQYYYRHTSPDHVVGVFDSEEAAKAAAFDAQKKAMRDYGGSIEPGSDVELVTVQGVETNG